MKKDASHRERWITRAELARRVGRSRGRITEACKGPLSAAVDVGRGLVDAAHPDVVRWAHERGVSREQLLPEESMGKRKRKRSARSRRSVRLGDETFEGTKAETDHWLRHRLLMVEIDGVPVIGTPLEAVDHAAELGRRMVAVRDEESGEWGFVDVDHPAFLEWLNERYEPHGRKAEPADLEVVWKMMRDELAEAAE